MYTIDFSKCSAVEVIQRSWVCHPSLFADGLKNAANIHGHYATTCHNAEASRIAEDCAKQCRVALTTLEDYPSGEGAAALKRGPLGPFVQAFHVACDLQCVPRHLRGDIIGRE
ncbi:hypothetical protein M2322_002644 [Rhodoblastus acidophilus]|uniref:hypothetical protein n=1 Tax=Rhodoblastus acidophilus TaxID=1074 RepID=UPI002224C5F0|nr:hypothetical protein [Rhodoblastus acidophilus]MCW2317090.1 hypothetical protein [Rhodoblastus acidophilus]